jgi:hypothetical protein
MKTKTISHHFSLRCMDQRVSDPLLIGKKKILIGSAENCDFILTDKSISSIHAFLCIKGEGFMVKDLYSETGVFVNGKRIEEGSVYPGDTITFGTLSFSIDDLGEDVPVFNPDEEIISPVAATYFDLPDRSGLVFVDGEYCDIKFDDTLYRPLDEAPKSHFNHDYIDLDETEAPLDIASSVQNKRLEVISYVNGSMMEVNYLNLKNGDYYLSPIKKTKFDILFNSSMNKTKIFSIQKGSIHFHPNDQFTASLPWEKISLNSPFFLSSGTEQVSFRLVDHITHWKRIPAFYRDRESLVQQSKIFATVFLPMLLLLFVTIPKDEKIREEIAVVYKLPEKILTPSEATEKSELKTEVITSKTENSGHKENDRPDQKVEFAAASQNKKILSKAAAPSSPAAQMAKTPPVKAYEFKSSVAFNSLVGDAPSINTQGSSSKSALKDANFNAGSSSSGELVAGADIGVSKFNGSDKKGNGSGSYGSRGLASKSGFDSSYLEPKTVVLGSMDPELLRKILREYIPQFRHCYQQELIGQSDKIKGVIDLNFTVSALGKVSKYNIKVKDAQFSQKGIGCMGQVLAIIDFPIPKGGGVVDVRQPLNFFAETEKI